MKTSQTFCDICGKEFDGTDRYYQTTVEVDRHAGGHGENIKLLLCTRNDCGINMIEYIKELKEKGREEIQKTINRQIVEQYEELQKR